jgi:hypothetical protein
MVKTSLISQQKKIQKKSSCPWNMKVEFMSQLPQPCTTTLESEGLVTLGGFSFGEMAQGGK